MSGMTPAVAIAARGLSKTYRIYPRPLARLWAACGGRARHRALRALDDVTFTVPAGEGLGIIGENGAGKSTLLKVLCGVTQATAGSLRVDGRVAAILELGAGFHPEFSGRQNAVLNAALLGLSEREVEAALPRILDFSELGDFIDRPVKTAVQHLEGQKVPAMIDTGVQVVTPENITSPEMQAHLNPPVAEYLK